MAPPATTQKYPFLTGGGAMAELISAFDWASTPLGPIGSWPASRCVAIGAMLRADVPIATLWGAQGILVYNAGYAAFSGARHPQLLGMPVREAWPEATAFNDHVMQVCLAGGTLSYKDQSFALDRHGVLEPLWVNLDYSPLLDEDGVSVGVMALLAETTQKVMLERQLLGERQRLAQLFEQAPSFMATVEGPTHRFVLANARYMRLVGERPVIGRLAAEALPDAAAQGLIALLDQVYRSGEALSAHALRYAVQADPQTPPVERHVDVVLQPIRDTAGTVTGIFIEGVDVTERMLAETRREALAQLTDRFQLLDDDRAIAFAAAEIIGRTMGVCRVGYGDVSIDIDTGAETLRVDHDWTDAGVPSISGVLTLRHDGSFIDDLKQGQLVVIEDVREDPRTHASAGEIEALCVRSLVQLPVLEQEQLVAMLFVNDRSARAWLPEEVAFLREVAGRTRTATERVRSEAALRASEARLREANETLEQKVLQRTHELMEVEARLRQSQKMEAIGQLTGGIAHDFNNLLGGMSTSLQVLEKRLHAKKFDNAVRYIGLAQDSVRRAASLTQRLLAFSRRQTLDPKPTDVNRLVGGIEEMVRRTVGPSVDVEVVGAGGLWATKVDASQLENAVLNLCINARDAMTPNGGRLTIETANKWLDDRAAAERELSPGQYVSICVTDTGTGMSPEVVARAFDPFFTTKPMGQGTGLGLSMVYGFVRQSGGQVRIYSELGKGTTMCLYLPRHVGEAGLDAVVARPAFDHRADGEVVLVVEDEATIRELIAEELQEAGYRVIAVGDGLAALNVLQSDERVDLLLTDVGLPGGLNGRQVADAGRVTRPGLQVLFITGYAENAAVGNGLLAYGMEVITKPFDVAALATKVQQMIDR